MRRKPPRSRGITLRVRETVQKKSMQPLPTMMMKTENGIQSPRRVENPPPRKSERWRKKSSVVTAAIPRVPKIPAILEVKASKKLRHGAFNTSASKRWRGSRVNKLELKVYIKQHTCHTCFLHALMVCLHAAIRAMAARASTSTPQTLARKKSKGYAPRLVAMGYGKDPSDDDEDVTFLIKTGVRRGRFTA